MGTLAAGFKVLLLAVGEVSLVVHFLHVVRRCYTVTIVSGVRPTSCACFLTQYIRPHPACNLYKVLHARLHCNGPCVSDSTGRPWKLFS